MSDSNYLAHHGTKGMKWGVRKYQNPDGSLTSAGRERYGVGPKRSSQKYSSAAVVGMEAKYQAKRAGKSIGNAVKSAPKNISNTVKKTASDLSRMHNESAQASKVRRAKSKQERFEARQKRREEKAERMARKIAERESKKTLKELKDEFDEARMNDARRKVERLMEKREKIAEKAALEQQARELKKANKQLKKDLDKEAKGKFSIKKIKGMSNEEIADRIARLKQEGELVKLESSRNLSPRMKSFVDSVSGAATEATKELAKSTITGLGKKFLQEAGIDAGSVVKTFDDLSKQQNFKINERKEMERRAHTYRKAKNADGSYKFTIKEIAKRLGVSEDQVRDYLYE